MAFARGGKAAEEEAAKSRPSFGRAEFFSLKNEGDSIVLRPLDSQEEWIFVKQHSFVPTRALPSGVDEETRKNFPKNTGAVCRRDKAFAGIHTDCYVCDHMRKEGDKPFRPIVRLWGRFIVREPILGTDAMVEAGQIKPHQVNKVCGYQDEMVTEDEIGPDGKATGNKITHPRIVVANMSLDNFYGQLQGYAEGYADEGGILDRDFTVTRKGTGTDTEYLFTPRTPTPQHDLNDPELRAKYEVFAKQAHLSVPELEEMITYRASDEFFARYFDPTKPFPERRSGEGDSSGGAPAAQQAKPVEDEATQDKLAAMRARVRGANRNPADADEAAEAATASS